MDEMNTISLILSTIAIIVSIVTAFFQSRQEDRISQASIRAENCSSIFNNYLIKLIPEARRELRFDELGKLKNGDNLCTVLQNMLFGALFYKYDDENFYKELKESVQKLEDELVDGANKPHPELEDQQNILSNIQKDMKRLYQLIDKKRVGVKVGKKGLIAWARKKIGR